MRTISIYKRAYINIESEGIIYACQIYGEETDEPYFIFDGASHKLTEDERKLLKEVLKR